MKLPITILFLLLCTSVKAADNLILVTLDGVRWQEIFSGVDEQLMNAEKFSSKSNNIKELFWADDINQRKDKLVPFISRYIASNGSLIGDRNKQSLMSVANPWYFSYPGYSEIFTGIVDLSLNSNQKINNPQISFLEWLNGRDKYNSNLAVFGSWDVFPYIFNVARSELYVNAGYSAASNYPLSEKVKLLNKLQTQIPGPWGNVRHDAFTFSFAVDYLLKIRPKVLVISLGETDDFAHDGKYDEYIFALNRADQMIADLWQIIQSTNGYKDNTNLIITTDHGRGSSIVDWQHHASKLATQGYLKSLKEFKKGILGSQNIWLAAIGPGIKTGGLVITSQEIKQDQIAATALKLLNEPVDQFNANIGKSIDIILEKQIK